MRNTRSREGGAALPEYAAAIMVLFAAFAIGGALLQRAGEERAAASRLTVEHMVPCVPGGALQAAGPEACK